jgi:hypothetical protein
MKNRILPGLVGIVLAGACAVCSANAKSAVAKKVDQLIPQLGSTNVPDRYAAQMELQSLAVNAARPGAKKERAEMANLLAAKAADADVAQPARVWAVRQLEYIGGAESITALTLLLNGRDAELKECARRALEKNPADEAGSVLRTALEQGGDATWTIGLMQSLGERHDRKAVVLIKPYLRKPPASAAAAAALAKIASDESIQALWDAYAGTNRMVGDALILAGARLLQEKEPAKAGKIFSKLYQAPASTNDVAGNRIRAAALIGLAKADPAGARPFIVAELQGGNRLLAYAAATAAPVAYEPGALSREFAPLLAALPNQSKLLVLRELDASAEPQVIALVNETNEAVRIVAIETMGRIGGVASVPVLVKAAADASPAQKAALGSLARIKGTGVGAAIDKVAQDGDVGARVVAIKTLAARDQTESVPALVKYAGEPERKISDAACAALGKLGGDSEIQPLAALALAGQTPGAADALQAVAARAKDKTAVSRKLLSTIPASADAAQLPLLFDTLASLGGADALAAVTNYLAGTNATTRDAAIRALANWPDFAAVNSLLAIAADTNATRVHQVLCLQGVVRLVKAADAEPVDTRLGAALLALNAAAREQEKKLVFSAIAAVPDVRAAEAIKPYLNEPKYEPEAALAGMTLAESLRKTQKAAARELAEAIKAANVSDELTHKATTLLNRK